MPQLQTDFDRLIENVRTGSQEAAWELVERYSGKILRVVRRCLPDQMRSKFDSQDFLQATWHSVFQNASRLGGFEKAEEFTAFIAGVACNKVKMEVRRRVQGQKYNVGRERSLEDSPGERNPEFCAAGPTPSQVAVARERWFMLLEGQPVHYRQIIEMRFSGNSIREIAGELHMHEATIQRVLRKLTVAF